MSTTRRAWAIRLGRSRNAVGSPDDHGLAGYGYFGWERPAHLGGYVTATFATRATARQALAGMKAPINWPWPHARVVPVVVSVVEVLPSKESTYAA